jgi:mono/diheme cytochrome c family protein
LARRFRLPIELLRPRNFTLGKFHGGDRPIDQYWRICVGIKGTPMPPAGPAPGSQGVLKAEQIWDVVHYVRSLGR